MSLLKSNIKKKEDFDIFVDQFLLDFELSFEKTLSLIDKPVLNSAKEVSLGGGKRYRPTLCFLCGYPRASYSELIKASIVLELVHIASLVHDDVLDNSKFRRGKLAIHHNIGVNESILLGDALFSYALELSTEFSENLVCKIVSKDFFASPWRLISHLHGCVLFSQLEKPIAFSKNSQTSIRIDRF